MKSLAWTLLLVAGCFRFKAAPKLESSPSHHPVEQSTAAEIAVPAAISSGDAIQVGASGDDCPKLLRLIPNESYFHILQSGLKKGVDPEAYLCSHYQQLSRMKPSVCSLGTCVRLLPTIDSYRAMRERDYSEWEAASHLAHKNLAVSECYKMMHRIESTKDLQTIDEQLSRRLDQALQTIEASTTPQEGPQMSLKACLTVYQDLKKSGKIWSLSGKKPMSINEAMRPFVRESHQLAH